MADSIASAMSRPDEEQEPGSKDPKETAGPSGGSPERTAGGADTAASPDGPAGEAGDKADTAEAAGTADGPSGDTGKADAADGPTEKVVPAGMADTGGAPGGSDGGVDAAGEAGEAQWPTGKADMAEAAGTAGRSSGEVTTAEAAGTSGGRVDRADAAGGADGAGAGKAAVAARADALPYGLPGRAIAKSPFMFGLTAALGVLTALGLAQALVSARSVIVLTLVALFLAAGLNPIVEALQRRRVPRRVAISIVFVVVIAFFGLFGLAIVPPVTAETTNFVRAIPGYVNELLSNETIKQLDAEFQLLARLRDYVVSGDLGATVAGGILGAGAVVLDGIFSGFTLLVLTLYFLGSLPTIKEYLLSLVPASRRARTRAMSDEILDGIGGYVAGNVLISVIAGVTAWLFLVIAGAEYALALALVVAVTDLIPLVGATIGAVVVTGVTLLQSVPLGIASGIFFLVYQQVENYLIYPKVMNRSVDVAPAVTIIAALFGGALLGIVGALIAIPAAAAVALIIREVVIPRQAAL